MARPVILTHYKALKEKKVIIPILEHIQPKRTEKGREFFSKVSLTYDELFKQNENQNANEYQINLLNEVEKFYVEYIRQGKDLRKFLESGAADVLLDINGIAEYRIALEATKDQKGEGENVLITDQMKLVYASWRDPDKDKDNNERRMYQFHVIVDAPKATLDQIESVTYRLPPAWKD